MAGPIRVAPLADRDLVDAGTAEEDVLRRFEAGADSPLARSLAERLSRAELLGSHLVLGTHRRPGELPTAAGAAGLASAVAHRGPVTAGSFDRLHRRLTGSGSGTRRVPNWVGGPDPAHAVFLPPQPGEIPPLLEDLAAFCNRTDLAPLTQAAVAYGQFQAIHPFVDGNGRVGRALLRGVLQRHGIGRRVLPPIGLAMMRDPGRFVDNHTRYRQGDAAAWCRYTRSVALEAVAAMQALLLDPAQLSGRKPA